MYGSIESFRAAGFTEEQFSDDRLMSLCEQVTHYIDLVTGRWFEPREMTIRLDGNGGTVLPLPHFLIETSSVKSNGVPVGNYVLYNRSEDRDYPKLYLESGWPRGALNIEISGQWGYVEILNDGTYITPPLILRAAMKMISLTGTTDLGDTEATYTASLQGRYTKEVTDGHSYELKDTGSDSSSGTSYTGDEEIDQILDLYSAKGMGLGLI